VQVRFVQQRSSAANTTKTLQKKRPLWRSTKNARNLRLLRTRATIRGKEKWTPESGYFMVSNGYQIFYGHISLCFKLNPGSFFLSFFLSAVYNRGFLLPATLSEEKIVWVLNGIKRVSVSIVFCHLFPISFFRHL
jgi:hypothetical protein